MTRNDQSEFEERLQAYQDGLLSEVEHSAFEATIGERPDVASLVRMQSDVDDSLRRQFQPPAPLEEPLLEVSRLSQINGVRPRLSGRRRIRWVAALVTVALVAWGVVAWQLQFGGAPWDEPYFESRPLVEIYYEAIDRGFKPYYECHDEERFAYTFELRQGRRLRLTQLPEGRQMLGLSYSGGLSRDTTAMLCIVDELPVVVFVDRADVDQSQSFDEMQSRVNVFRREYAGLVLYEVTPHPEQRILDHLVAED